MARRKTMAAADADVQAVLDSLGPYAGLHPKAKLSAYRHNSASIRIRVVDPDFAPLDRALRHDLVWALLRQLSDDIQSQITLVLLLTPDETKKSFANMDFEDPIPSRL